jgi:hypothetical protein
MPNYDYNINTVIGWCLPSPIRKFRLFAYIRALCTPLKQLHTQFILLKNSAYFDLKYNGQVCFLRGCLNDVFDPTLRRILIEDGIEEGFVYIFLESENQPFYLPSFLTGSEADFVVLVPSEYANQIDVITAFVQKFKLYSKSFKIKFI